MACLARDASTLRAVVAYCDAHVAAGCDGGDALLRTTPAAELRSLLLTADFLVCTPLVEALCLALTRVLAKHAMWEAQTLLLGGIAEGYRPPRAKREAFRRRAAALCLALERDDAAPVTCKLPRWRSAAWHSVRLVSEATLQRMEARRLERRAAAVAGCVLVVGMSEALHMFDMRTELHDWPISGTPVWPSRPPGVSGVGHTARAALGAAYIGGGRVAYLCEEGYLHVVDAASGEAYCAPARFSDTQHYGVLAGMATGTLLMRTCLSTAAYAATPSGITELPARFPTGVEMAVSVRGTRGAACVAAGCLWYWNGDAHTDAALLYDSRQPGCVRVFSACSPGPNYVVATSEAGSVVVVRTDGAVSHVERPPPDDDVTRAVVQFPRGRFAVVDNPTAGLHDDGRLSMRVMDEHGPVRGASPPASKGYEEGPGEAYVSRWSYSFENAAWTGQYLVHVHFAMRRPGGGLRPPAPPTPGRGPRSPRLTRPRPRAQEPPPVDTCRPCSRQRCAATAACRWSRAPLAWCTASKACSCRTRRSWL